VAAFLKREKLQVLDGTQGRKKRPATVPHLKLEASLISCMICGDIIAKRLSIPPPAK
jgi:hypothetical protein